MFAKFPEQKRPGLTASVYEDGAYDCAASVQWSDPDTLHILAQIIDAYMGSLSISLCFKDDGVSIAMHKPRPAFRQSGAYITIYPPIWR